MDSLGTDAVELKAMGLDTSSSMDSLQGGESTLMQTSNGTVTHLPLVDKAHEKNKTLSVTIDEVDTESMDGDEVLAAITAEPAAYPRRAIQWIICTALGASMFLPALDRQIIAVAVPRITDEFHSLEDVGWYGSSYVLTLALAQLPFGKACTLWRIRTCFLVAIAVFEIGSLIAGFAVNSPMFIVGRTISGLGASGVFAGGTNLLVYTLPISMRPLVNGLISLIAGGMAALGAPLGGALTEKLSWRWCFYINPILGFPIAATAWYFTRNLQLPTPPKQSIPSKLAQFDWSGLGALSIAIVTLLTALQWGGIKHPWSSGPVVAMLVVFPVMTCVFLAIQWRLGDAGIVPLRIFRQRTIATGATYCLAVVGGSLTISYYLPLYFQATRDVSPLRSGVLVLPLAVSDLVFSLVAGVLVTVVGYYTPLMILGGMLLAAGSVIFAVLPVAASLAYEFSAQLLVGIGSGIGYEAPLVAAQLVLGDKDAPLGIAIILFAQYIGQSIFTSVGGAILANRIVVGIEKELPGVAAAAIVESIGATALFTLVPASSRPTAIRIVAKALNNAFIPSAVLGGVALVAACLTEWRSVKTPKADESAEAGSMENKIGAVDSSEE